jgi:hypothetical protein
MDEYMVKIPRVLLEALDKQMVSNIFCFSCGVDFLNTSHFEDCLWRLIEMVIFPTQVPGNTT